MEDLNLYLKDVLTERPHTRVPSADTVLRGIEELATENISYTAEKTGNVYDFNTAEKLNQLLIKLLLATGQLAEGGEYDVDFDHQFLEAEKYDSKRTYKGFDGYSPGVFTIGGLIAYLENRDGNANVRFMQAETHRRFFEMMRSFGIHVRSFRADCGSYSEDIVKMVMEHTDKFYIRAERYAGLYEKVKRQTGSRASCSDSSPCRPSGLGLQGKMHSTSTLASHTTSSGLTDRKNTFVGHSSRQSDFGERGIVRPSATSCKTLLLAVVMRAIHWVHVPILRIKKTSADFGTKKD